MATTTTATAAKSKADKFKELANSRVNKALAAIALIGNLSAKANYEYTDEQVKKITDALNAKVSNTMGKFAPGAKVEAEGFTV